MDERTDDVRDGRTTSAGSGPDRASPVGRDVRTAAHDLSAPRSAADARQPPWDKVDDESEDSFPASDSPSWTGMRAGSPREHG